MSYPGLRQRRRISVRETWQTAHICYTKSGKGEGCKRNQNETGLCTVRFNTRTVNLYIPVFLFEF